MYTLKEKQIIKSHYPHLILRFTKDGSVLAQQAKGRPFGLLYTAIQARSHINAVLTVNSQMEKA